MRPVSTATLSATLALSSLATATANVYPSTSNMDNFLIVGMTDHDTGGDCVNLQNGEYGADQDVLSTDQCNRGTSLTDSSFPTLDSVFDQRWKSDKTGCNPAPSWCVEYEYKGETKCCAPTTAVDWSGNIAATSTGGMISVSDTDIYGDLDTYGYKDIAILAAGSKPVQSISNAQYFPMGHNPGYQNTIGTLPENEGGTDGVGFMPKANLDDLKDEIEDWSDSIKTYDAEHEVRDDIENRNKKDSSKGPFLIELLPQGAKASGDVDWSFDDTNGDGVIVIDVVCGSDWKINNADVVIVGDDSVTAIFRVRKGSNMLIDNSSIQRCEGSPGILFAVGVDEENQSGDAVMGGSNAVLNNVVFWELVNGAGDSGKNLINCQNCQGCSQFIADVVLHTSTSRFNKCTYGAGGGGSEPVPDPAPKEEETCSNSHTCDCFTCDNVDVDPIDGSLTISIGHCKNGDISWMCCAGVDNKRGNCDVTGPCNGPKCEGVNNEGLTINVPGTATNFTINTHDGKTQGDALNVHDVCGGPKGGQGGSCATNGFTAHCLIEFDIAKDCGYSKGPAPSPDTDPTPKEPVPAPAPEEPVPAPKEPVPAPEEPVPAPKEPVPAPEEPVPAPKELEPVPAPEETCSNSHDCGCFTCDAVDMMPDGTLSISVGHCKNGDISWMCCAGVDGGTGNCDVTGPCNGPKCEGVDNEGLTVNVPGDSTYFTINTHDGKTQGDALNVQAVCGGPKGGQGGSCATNGFTAHCLIDFNIADDCGYMGPAPSPDDPVPPPKEPVPAPEEPVPAPEITVCESVDSLDFETDGEGKATSAGDLAENLWDNLGISITTSDPKKPAMLFDTANPTGGDKDLASDTEGMVLIISEGGDSDDPDDNAHGGTITIDFTTPVCYESMGVFDMEDQTIIKMYDQDGNLLGGERKAPIMKDGESRSMDLDTCGVYKMEVIMVGSGAVTDLQYCMDPADSPEPKTIKVCRKGRTGNYYMKDIDIKDIEDLDVAPGDDVTIDGVVYTLSDTCEVEKPEDKSPSLVEICVENPDHKYKFSMQKILESSVKDDMRPGDEITIDGAVYTLSDTCTVTKPVPEPKFKICREHYGKYKMIEIIKGDIKDTDMFPGQTACNGIESILSETCICLPKSPEEPEPEVGVCRATGEDIPYVMLQITEADKKGTDLSPGDKITIEGTGYTLTDVCALERDEPEPEVQVCRSSGDDTDPYVMVQIAESAVDKGTELFPGDKVTINGAEYTLTDICDLEKPAPKQEPVPEEPESKPEPRPVPDEPEPEEPPTKPLEPSPPATKASGSGDPHFKTWTGHKYDYHGECDLVLVDNPSFADGKGLRVHIRTTRVKYFSFIEKVAIQIGDDILEFDNDAQNFLINGAHAETNRKHHKSHVGGFKLRRDPKAISIRLSESMRSGPKIDLHTRKNGFPAVILDGAGTDVFKGSLGLLGDWETGKRLARDGKTEMQDHDATPFALEWQVHDTEPMLFKDARFPQFPTTCTPPAKMLSNRLGASSFEMEAEKACAHWKEDKEDCIFDVIATRDVLVAAEGHIVHLE